MIQEGSHTTLGQPNEKKIVFIQFKLQDVEGLLSPKQIKDCITYKTIIFLWQFSYIILVEMSGKCDKETAFFFLIFSLLLSIQLSYTVGFHLLPHCK